jgi:hypothetical protein
MLSLVDSRAQGPDLFNEGIEFHLYPSLCMGNLASAPLSQPGDSGGPVFTQVNGRAYAQGIISAGTSDHETVVFSDMSYVASVFSGTPSVAP